LSIDIAPFARSYGFNVALTFTGYRNDGTTATRHLTGPPAMQFDKYTFAGFTDLRELRWRHGQHPFHQFDNIVLNQVPEPATGALLAVSSLAVVLVRRRR